MLLADQIRVKSRMWGRTCGESHSSDNKHSRPEGDKDQETEDVPAPPFLCHSLG